MATFAKSSFNTAVYAASRPTYPGKLFDHIFNYYLHKRVPKADEPTPLGDSEQTEALGSVAVDLGCGTGQATTALKRFTRVIGVDPSLSMIDQAKQHCPDAQFEFIQSSAEQLDFIQSSTVDLIIAAQSCHWFNWKRLWPEINRILRPGGAAAFWVYSEFRLPKYPSTIPMITEYAQGDDPVTSLGPHFQRPGRTILERHLIDVPEPHECGANDLSQINRIYFTGNYYPNLPEPLPPLLQTKTTWLGLLGYLRTFSSLNTYQELYPADAERRIGFELGGKPHPQHGKDGDIAERFWLALLHETNCQAETEVEIEWPVAMLLVHKRN